MPGMAQLVTINAADKTICTPQLNADDRLKHTGYVHIQMKVDLTPMVWSNMGMESDFFRHCVVES